MPQISETLKGSFTKFFGTLRQKIFDGNLWYPLICIKFFDTPNFLRHWREAHEIFRHCETKKFRRQILIPPLSYPNFFGTRNYWNTKRFPYEVFWHCETKNFDGKSWCSPLSYPNFLDTRNYCNSKGFPYGNFRHCETKNFRRKILMLPSPLSYPNFLDTRNYCNSKGFPCGNFRHCETKNFRRKILMPPSLIQTFSIPEIIATVKASRTEIFGTVRQKISDGKSWYSPPPLVQFFSIPEINETLKNSPPYGNFRHCETKNFRRKLLIPPPPSPSLMHKIFRYPKFSDTPKCSPTKFFGSETKNFERKVVHRI